MVVAEPLVSLAACMSLSGPRVKQRRASLCCSMKSDAVDAAVPPDTDMDTAAVNRSRLI
jgi:hypothetical protein